MPDPSEVQTREAETPEARKLRRKAEALATVAQVWPAILDTSAIDMSLIELRRSRTVLERLEAAWRFQLGKAWLRGLQRAKPSSGG